MIKKLSIVLGVAALMVACNTVQLAPLDDAYYYPDKKESAAAQNTPSTQNIQNTQSTPKTQSAPAVEYVNIQDTTVTIRIRK